MGCRIGATDSGPGRNGRCPDEAIPFWPGSTPSALGMAPALPANGGHPIPGASRGLPLTRWTTSTRPGLQKASGHEDDVWKGQKEGSVD